MSVSRWSATIESKNKTVLAYCSTINSAQLSVALNDKAQLDCSFSIDGPDATALLTALASSTPLIRLAENGVTRFWGPLSSLEVSGSDAVTVQASFVDAVGALDSISTYYYTVNRRDSSQGSVRALSYNRKPFATIVDGLLALGSPLVRVVRSGSLSSTGRNFLGDGASVLEALKKMSDLYTGFDFYGSPDATLKVASALGTNKSTSVAFQSGSSGQQNIAAYTSQFQPPRNHVFSQDVTKLVTDLKGTSTSITNFGEYADTAKRVGYWGMETSDVLSGRLREAWINVVSLDLEPTVCPRPWTDFYLGDTVSVLINATGSAYSYTGTQRVSNITIQFDEQMEESGINVSFEAR
jgi:hypothetical protein